MEATEREKPLVKELNEHIVCPLCRGYLVDATTLVECLHSFCRGCIVRRLSSGARACPVCNVATSPPLLPDAKLQRLVYLLVPGLFRSELERRRHFRLVNPQCPPLAPPLGALELTLDDFVSLSLCELDEPEEEARGGGGQSPENRAGSRHRPQAVVDQTKREEPTGVRSTRYLKCPAGVTVRHLVRLLMLKRGWEEANSTGVNKIEMLCERGNEEPRDTSNMMALDHSWTLLDLACIFGWKRDLPMKLFYRVTRKEGGSVSVSVSRVSPYNDETSKDVAATMENIQRPPTPPPSPKPVQECEVEARRILESSTEPARSLETNLERDKEPKAKKPRCEVTPVMRTPDLVPMQPNHVPESSKSKELARLEHRKRRKRRNKRVIAEITTTPREDLLKLKVRLTPCPPRITSTSAAGQTKEKLLQMRAVRREKIKASARGHRSTSSVAREEGAKESIGETEETIEEIIDSIPDEVVRIAQNISTPAEETGAERPEQRNLPQQTVCGSPSKTKEESEPETAKTTVQTEAERPKKDEEILRRLGLVAVNEANEKFREKAKQRVQNIGEKIDSLDREKLEKQLRESKANRVRSLLAEKQMRDTLKSIRSKTKEEQPVTPVPVPVNATPKKKGPPPLAPLRVAKPSGFAASSAILEPNNSKYEIPLDLSSGGTTVHNKVLDLSANLSANLSSNLSAGNFSTSSSSSSSSSPSSSSSSSSSCSSTLNPRPPRPGIATGSLLRGKTKDLVQDQRRGQESNLVTLSDAAVSLLSGCISDKDSVDPLVLSSANIASKVALRIPQPHQRISGFGMKIKPNLGIRHIPNPQAVVASQYRNQRASFFNAASQQPP